MKNISEFEEVIRKKGQVTFQVAGVAINFDLANRHERAYAAKLLMDIHHPQADIDLFIFKRFIKPGDNVLDAGANIGFTALECLEVGAKKVIAVEALPDLHRRLSKLTSEKLVAVKAALSSEQGEAEFFVSTAHNQGSSLKKEMIEIFPSVFGQELRKINVELTTIDRLVEVFGAFDVWKLDIEGAEFDALMGALNTLKKCPPRIIIAELYDDFYDEFFSFIKATHPFVRRALIPKDNYKMELHAPLKGFPDGFHQTSPMYVFSNVDSEIS